MKTFNLPIKINKPVLALGAESAGNFSLFKNDELHFFEGFGDLMLEQNFQNFENELEKTLKKNRFRPKIILCDLHPLFRTTSLAKKLGKKYGAKVIAIQHHLAHIFSAVGDKMIQDSKFKIPASFLGVACDGTGYGTDGKVWGGEIFKIKHIGHRLKVERIGRLENQLLLGGEKAIEHPARILISILAKFLKKSETYVYAKKHYSKKEFDLIWSQFEQKFNCLETSSTARILDSSAVLLGFSKNNRTKKHGPVALLEKNSTKAYQLKPVIRFDEKDKLYILETTPLFKYLIKNLSKDKNRLAATAQKYIAEGLIDIYKKTRITKAMFAGGMANNKIIASELEKSGFYLNKKIPRGDEGISFGQISYFLLADPGDQFSLRHFNSA